MSETNQNRITVPIRPLDIDSLAGRLKKAVNVSSVSKASQQSGVSEATIRNILSGKSPTLDNCVALANALGVRMGWLSVGEEPMRPWSGLPDDAQVKVAKMRDAAATVVQIFTDSASPPSLRWGMLIQELMALHDLSPDGARRLVVELKTLNNID